MKTKFAKPTKPAPQAPTWETMPVVAPLFRVRQEVTFAFHNVGYIGEVDVVTWWRRSGIYAYRVQCSDQHWRWVPEYLLREYQEESVTGRLIQSQPNLQNIPIRTELGAEIRKSFVRPLTGRVYSEEVNRA